MEKDPAISQAKWRKQMLASLPKLFDMVYFLFQSIRRSVVTKEELIQKIITGHLDIVDRSKLGFHNHNKCNCSGIAKFNLGLILLFHFNRGD